MTALSRFTDRTVRPGGSARRRRSIPLPRRARSVVAAVGVAVLLLLALLGDFVAPYDPNVGGQAKGLLAPDGSHVFGTDQSGRDVLSRVLSGARISMTVSIGSVLIGVVLGGLLGMIAGLRSGRWLGELIMRVMDAILSFPVLVLAAVLSGIAAGRTLHIGPLPLGATAVVTLVIGFVQIPVFARIARSSVIAEMQEEYIVAARTSGARSWALLVRHLLPNVQGPLVVQAAFSAGVAIILESSLSYLGLGIQPPQASWGNILSDGQSSLLLGAWWLIVFPTLFVIFATLSFNFLGDSLRDALDPRHQSSAASAVVPPIETAETQP